jgi:drug/metabolite transporter superfamily protein YnfA
MAIPFSGYRALAALTAVFGACYLLWAWAVHGSVSTSTFAVIALLVAGMVTVTLVTWKNAQATGSVGQLLHDTDTAADPAVKR